MTSNFPTGGDSLPTSIVAGTAGHPADHAKLHDFANDVSLYLRQPPRHGVAVLIAGSNMPGTYKDKCDFVCDGTADQAEFAAAVNSLPAEGGVIEFAGAFSFNAKWTITRPITLRGAGQRVAKITLASGLNDYGIMIDAQAGSEGRDHWIFESFTVDGNAPNQTAGGCIYGAGVVQSVFRDLRINRPFDIGLYIGQSAAISFGHHNRILSCLFDGGDSSAGRGQGMVVGASDENFIIGCDFESNGGLVVSEENTAQLKLEVGLNTVLDCVFVNGRAGIASHDCNDNRIIGCIFDGSKGDQVRISGSRVNVSHCSFTSAGSNAANNICSCIRVVFGDDGCTITDNFFASHTTNTRTRSLIRFEGSGGQKNHVVTGNRMQVLGTLGTATVEDAAISTVYRDNPGYVHPSEDFYATRFGVRADGATNDQAAFQAAVDATPVGAALRLPKGTIRINTPVLISKRITFIGDGPRSTIISLPNGFNAYAFRFTQVSGDLSGCVFRDFRIECNGPNQTAGGGFEANGAIYCSWERVHFIQPHTAGLFLAGQPGGAFGFQNVVHDCLFDQGEQSPGPGRGVWMQSNDENLISDSRFQFMGGAGTNPNAIRDEAGLQLIDNCVFVRGKIGIRSQDANNTRINACTFDGVDHHGIVLTGGRHQVTNNHFTSIGGATANTYSCLYMESNTNQCVVTGNVMVPHPTAGQTRSLIREEGNGANVYAGNIFAILEGTCGTAYVERNTGGAAGLSVFAANRGFRTTAVGTAQITATTSVVVSHTLAATPTRVVISPASDPGAGLRWWVSAKTATTFTITVSASATVTFEWYAQVGEA